MKRLLTGAVLLFFPMLINAQKDLEKETIMILPESELIISGSTNVNKFDCRFNIELISSEKQIKYTQEENLITFSDLKLHLLTEGFDCGNKRMNSDFQDLLQCEKYPEIVIELDRIESISTEYSKAFVKVHLAGKSNAYNLPVIIIKDRFKGKFKINIRDFGLEPPTKALGLIEVDEQIEVQFDLKVLR